MEHSEIIERLSGIDDLEFWTMHTRGVPHSDRKKVVEYAEEEWIKRKLNDGSLLVHPNVRNELIERNYKPLTKHRKMIWASVLVSYDGPDSKERFQRIKAKIVAKYSNKWWFDVYNRIKPTYAARQRLLKQQRNTGSALEYAASASMFFGNLLCEERDKALKMIPED